jgi:hypothetical protein
MPRDDLEIIRRMIVHETRYLRHYIGQVQSVDDSASRGRVEVFIPALGWDTPESAIWCWPRDKESLVPPHVGDTVEVYFMDGRPDRPVFLGQVHEVAEQAVADYESPTKPVLYQNRVTGDKLVYDEESEVWLVNDGDKEAARVDSETLTDSTTDAAAWSALAAFFGVVTGAPITEPGNGSPSALQAALSSALSGAGGAPSALVGKVTTGYEKVKLP